MINTVFFVVYRRIEGNERREQMTKEIRNEKIMTRFSKEEMKYVDDLRQRVNCKTNGKLIRNIILAVAQHSEFDFLALDMNLAYGNLEMRNQLLLFEKFGALVGLLEEENILPSSKSRVQDE